MLYSIVTSFQLIQDLCSQNIGAKDYYERQFDTLKSFEDVDSVVLSEELDEEDVEEQAQHERAMKISNYANILLLALKVSNVVLNVVLISDFFFCCLKKLLSRIT